MFSHLTFAHSSKMSCIHVFGSVSPFACFWVWRCKTYSSYFLFLSPPVYCFSKAKKNPLGISCLIITISCSLTECQGVQLRPKVFPGGCGMWFYANRKPFFTLSTWWPSPKNCLCNPPPILETISGQCTVLSGRWKADLMKGIHRRKIELRFNL